VPNCKSFLLTEAEREHVWRRARFQQHQDASCHQFSTCDTPRPGRSKTVTTPEIIDQIHELIFEDGRISAKSIAEQRGILRERVGSIIHEDLETWKLSAKWVPKCMDADQKRQRCQASEQIWNFFGLI